jgi:hypothetical protein
VQHPDVNHRFWHEVWFELSKTAPEYFSEEFDDSDGFTRAFAQPPQDGRQIILAWDEFDKYSTQPGVTQHDWRNARWADILDALRTLRTSIRENTRPLLAVSS